MHVEETVTVNTKRHTVNQKRQLIRKSNKPL